MHGQCNMKYEEPPEVRNRDACCDYDGFSTMCEIRTNVPIIDPYDPEMKKIKLRTNSLTGFRTSSILLFKAGLLQYNEESLAELKLDPMYRMYHWYFVRAERSEPHDG